MPLGNSAPVRDNLKVLYLLTPTADSLKTGYQTSLIPSLRLKYGVIIEEFLPLVNTLLHFKAKKRIMFFMLKVYIINTKIISNKSAFDYVFLCLDEARKKRIAGLKNRSSVIQTAAAGYLLYYGLKQLGMDIHTVSIKNGPHGKPYLSDCPDIHFNLSHSGEYAVMALSDRNVGIDIEKLRPVGTSVIKKAFGEKAAEEFVNLPEEDSIQKFAELWTSAESYGKLSGEGVFTLLGSPLSSVDSISGYCFHKCTDIEGYFLTVCSSVSDAPDYEYITKL